MKTRLSLNETLFDERMDNVFLKYRLLAWPLVCVFLFLLINMLEMCNI